MQHIRHIGSLAATILISLVTMVGIAEGHEPMGVCIASEANGQVLFTRTSHQGWSFDFGRPVRTKVANLEVRQPSFRFLWGIRANDSGASVAAVTYGELPPGYSQYFPQSGEPTPLKAGEVYELTCGLGEGAFLVTATGIENLDPRRASAPGCTCPPEDSLMAALGRTSTVFVGTVVTVTRPADPTDNGYRRTEFFVSRWLKGAGGDRAVVLDGPLGCMVSFEEGRRFLVYARQRPNSTDLVTDMCTRTKPLNRSGQREADLIAQQFQAHEVDPNH